MCSRASRSASSSQILEPAAPPEVLAAARRLRYRELVVVALITTEQEPFPDNWIYLHDPGTRAGRVQNFGAWSESMVRPGTSCLGVEYFCFEGDEIWEMPEERAVELAKDELAQIGLIDPSKVVDGVKVRVPKAYPMYDTGYREAVGVVREYVDRFENLKTFGRNGLHRYNNQDHSMWTAILATLNLIDGTAYDVWSVNTEEEYLEEGAAVGRRARRRSDRLGAGIADLVAVSARGFEIYGLSVSVSGDWDEVVEGLELDFQWFVGPEPVTPNVRVVFERQAPDFDRFGEIPAAFVTPRNVVYQDGGRTIVDYFGRAVSILDRSSGTIVVQGEDEHLVHEAGYLFVLSRVGEHLDRLGLPRLHALGLVGLAGRGGRDAPVGRREEHAGPPGASLGRCEAALRGRTPPRQGRSTSPVPAQNRRQRDRRRTASPKPRSDGSSGWSFIRSSPSSFRPSRTRSKPTRSRCDTWWSVGARWAARRASSRSGGEMPSARSCERELSASGSTRGWSSSSSAGCSTFSGRSTLRSRARVRVSPDSEAPKLGG